MLLTGLMVGATVGAYLTFAWLVLRRPPTDEEVEARVRDARLLREVSERRRREAWSGDFQVRLYNRLMCKKRGR